MTELPDRIFDSLPLTAAAVLGAGTLLASLLALLLRQKGAKGAEASAAPAGGGETGLQAGKATRRKLPQGIMAAAFSALALGLAGVIANFNGVELNQPIFWGLALAGFLIFFGYDFAVNGAINRANYFKTALKYFSLLLIGYSALQLAGLALDVYGGRSAARGLAALALGGLGVLGYYYGSRFHQNLEAVAMGRAFGFVPAESGVFSEDWIYDSRGEMNGVPALFNIEVTASGGGKYSPTEYAHKLEVLCRCANPHGIKLRVREGWTGLWATVLSMFRALGLPKMMRPPAWKGRGRFRANIPERAADCIERSRADTEVFTEDFRELWLSGGELKLVFVSANSAWNESRVKRVLAAATRLAAGFNLR